LIAVVVFILNFLVFLLFSIEFRKACTSSCDTYMMIKMIIMIIIVMATIIIIVIMVVII